MPSSRIEQVVEPRLARRFESINERPWYSSFAPAGPEWSRALFAAIAAGELTPEDVKREVRMGLVRPSLVYQIAHRIEDPFHLPQEVSKADGAFLPPELKVTPEQLSALRRRGRDLRARWLLHIIKGRAQSVFSAPVKRVRARWEKVRPLFKSTERFVFKWNYRIAHWRWRREVKRMAGRVLSPEYDWVFVFKKKTADRVAEEMSMKLGARLGGKHCVYYAANTCALPRATAYYFPDSSFFAKCLKTIPALWGARTAVYFASPHEDGTAKDDLVFAFGRCALVICENPLSPEKLAQKGVKTPCLHAEPYRPGFDDTQLLRELARL